jgi:glycosyltransferase involved in cell wall biosynthesis
MTTRVAHQVLATLGYGDAIGHEVLGIQRVLREAGFRSDVFVETADPRLEHLTRDFQELPDDSHPDHLLVHHFSLGSKASRVAFALPDRMVLIYHNITPPEYFVGVNKHLVEQCYKGRRELGAYTRRVMMALGDSDYNRQELEHLGFPATGVLPVVPSFAHLDVTPDARLAQDFDDEWTNVLFVGRVIPNKKFDDVIRFFHVYKRDYNPRSRLLLVGAYSGFERYLVMLHHLVAKLRVPDVHFLGHVSNGQLTALYEAADLFLCASEHEGFCVPLVEAFYKDVPVIAYAATAVPATLDGAGVLYADKDQDYVAALMDGVVSNARLRDAIIDGQRQALARLLDRDFAATLLGFVDQALGAPGVPHPGVASDFWQQVEQAERLEELRRYRPSAYLALPPPPSGGEPTVER